MNNIVKLLQYVQKAADGYAVTSQFPSADVAPPTVDGKRVARNSASSTIKPYRVGSEIPSENRLYLVEGHLPNSPKTPKDLGLPSYTGEDKGNFIDERLLQRNHKETYAEAHPKNDSSNSYGGIIVDEKGRILIRKVTGKFGGLDWSLAKGQPESGESNRETALREVFEETGIKATLVPDGEVPGHHSSINGSTKYFLMNIEEDTGKLGKETDEIKWVYPEDAINIFKENADKDGTVHDSSQRDIKAVAAGMHHHQSIKPESLSARLARRRNGMSKFSNPAAAEASFIDHYLTHQSFPPGFTKANSAYADFRSNLGIHTSGLSTLKSEDSPGQIESYRLLSNLFEALDKKNGMSGADGFAKFHHKFMAEDWAGSGAGSTSNQIHLVQEHLSELNRRPLNFMYGNTLPEDVDFNGKPVYISDADRTELIDTYQKWKDNPEAVSATGEFTWGEQYDFADGKTHVVSVTRPASSGVESAEVSAWEMVISRAVRAKDAREKLFKTDKALYHTKTLKDQGTKRLLANLTKEALSNPSNRREEHQSKTDAEIEASHDGTPYGIQSLLTPNAAGQVQASLAGTSDKDMIDAGKEFVAEYASHVKTMTRMALDAAHSEDYVWIGRKTDGEGAMREVFGQVDRLTDAGMLEHSGNLNFSDTDALAHFGLSRRFQDAGDGTNEMESIAKPLKVQIHGSVISGGSANPTSYSQADNGLHIWSKVHKDDIFLTHSLHPLYAGGSERESIIMSNPETESWVWHVVDGNASKLWEQVAGVAGIAPKGLGVHKPGDFPRGVTNPEIDFGTVYKPAGKQLGSNTGGEYEDSTGKKFYIKHGTPESHHNEVLANTLYAAAGINVPKTALINFNGGRAVRSEWLSNPTEHKTHTGTIPNALKNNPDIQEGFLVDAMLSNWDVLGQNFDNIIESDGKFYRVDQGGALTLRAQGGEKHNFHSWQGDHIEDLDSMQGSLLDKGIGEQASQAFSDMSDKTLLAAANKLFKLTDSTIKDHVETSGVHPKQMDEMTDTLIRRRNSIHRWMKKLHPSVLEQAAVPNTDFNLSKAVDPVLEKLKKASILWLTGFPREKQKLYGAELEENIKKARKESREEFDALTGKDTS